MVLKGKVVDGLGNACFWVKKIENLFFTKYGIKLFQGTLNIELEEEYNLENFWCIEPEEYGGNQIVYVQECNVLEHNSYIVRAKETAHRANILEIISDVNFREKYNLTNGDIIEIIL